MGNFIKEHSYDAVKMFLNQFAIGIFGFSLALACGKAENRTLRLITSIVAIVFYLFLIYTMLWELGSKDKIPVEYGRKRRIPLTGLYIALMAGVVNYLLAIGITIGSSVGGVCTFLSGLLQGMYLGVLSMRIGGVALNTHVFLYYLIPLPAILTATVAYLFGLYDIRLLRTPNNNNKTDK